MTMDSDFIVYKYMCKLKTARKHYTRQWTPQRKFKGEAKMALDVRVSEMEKNVNSCYKKQQVSGLKD